MTQMDMRVKSAKELESILRVYGMDAAGAAEAWASMPKPVKVSQLIRPHDRYFDPYIPRLRPPNRLLKLAKVWQGRNLRLCLWNDKSLEIARPGNPRYNFLDQGFYEFNQVIIRTDRDYAEVAAVVDAVVKARTRGRVWARIEATLEELSSGSARVPVGRDGGLKDAAASIKGIDSSISIGEFFIEKGGLKYGASGVRLADYLNLGGIHWVHEARHGSVVSAMVREVASGVADYGFRGDFWMGAFQVRLDIEGENIMAEGCALDWQSFVHAAGLSMSTLSKDEFVNALKGLEETPIGARKLLKDGVTHIVGSQEYHRRYGERSESVLKFKFERDGKRWFILSPVDGRRSSPFRKFEDARDIGIEDKWSSGTVLGLFRGLSRAFGDAHACEIMRKGVANAEEAVRRARALLDGLVARHEGVVRAEFDGDPGFVVKGELRNYFVSMDGEVFAYPGGEQICIVEKDERPVISEDAVVSRICLLLNDAKLRAQVSTLGDAVHDGVELEEMEVRNGEGEDT